MQTEDAVDLAVFHTSLRRARLAARLSQEDLAKIVGTTRTSLSYWETDGAEPGRQNVFRLEEALSLPPGSLSQHLGYLPLAARARVGTIEALDVDPLLSPSQRMILKRVYYKLIKL